MKSYLKYFTLLFSLYFTEGAFRCDYTYSSKTQTWFKLVSLPANFTDARLRCTLEGAVLASPTTPEILAEMRTIMNRSYPEYEIFTGIHAIFSPGDFNTIEGTPLSKLPIVAVKKLVLTSVTTPRVAKQKLVSAALIQNTT
ncbi:hypothetical protein PYW07_010471 [Mythimna separata]|uniref:C-type lectin domain-containing protein n=1 Tax=Mythimna separata TaxID=271217 RepID=A0AAD8DME7_MYTSE|nr:hypothetical protein PYW07_010471 [Mythimna separata]